MGQTLIEVCFQVGQGHDVMLISVILRDVSMVVNVSKESVFVYPSMLGIPVNSEWDRNVTVSDF